MNKAKHIIKENDAMTFTDRLNYSVSEISMDEFLSAVSKRDNDEANKLRAKKAQENPTPIRK